MRQLRGKNALVTGAASGLGKAIALELAREGANLFLVDIDQAGLEAVADQSRQLGVETIAAQCDVTQPDQITATVRKLQAAWGGLDILINNVGVGYYGPTVHMTAADWNWLLAINLQAPLQFTRELLPALLDRAEAHVVNVASICGLVAGPRCTAYYVSKFGLVGFSEALRAEYGRQGLGVSAICPGPVLTRLFQTASTGRSGHQAPAPPAWICTTPQRVATKTIRAIRRDQGLVLVGWLAYALYYFKRLTPWLMDFAQRVGRRGKMRRKAAELARRRADESETLVRQAA